MMHWEKLITAPVVDVRITHELTCPSVPVQFEGQLEVESGIRVIGYYFRHRHGRWSLSIGHARELDDKYVVLASGVLGDALDGGVDHGLAVHLIDTVLVTWWKEGGLPIPDREATR